MNDILRAADGRHTLRLERRLAHPPEKVWRAVTEPEHLRHWFPSHMEIEPRVDGKIVYTFDAGGDDGAAGSGVVQDWDPPHLFAFTWNDDVIRIQVRPDGAGCLLVFEHTFDTRSAAASYGAGWHICLEALEQVLAGHTVDSAATPSGALHERYVRAFGLDEGTFDATGQGWQVHFDRQLTQPVERVWDVLLGEGRTRPTVGAPVPTGCVVEEFPAGPVAAVETPCLLAYEWTADGKTAGEVCWELRDGTGHGARLLLTQTGSGTPPDAPDAVLAAWRSRIEALARELADAAS